MLCLWLCLDLACGWSFPFHSVWSGRLGGGEWRTQAGEALRRKKKSSSHLKTTFMFPMVCFIVMDTNIKYLNVDGWVGE